MSPATPPVPLRCAASAAGATAATGSCSSPGSSPSSCCSALSSAVGTGYAQSFGDFDSEATRGFDLLEEGFGATGGENQGTIVFTAEQGVDDPEVQAAMTELFAAIEAFDEFGEIVVVSPYENPQQIAFQGERAGDARLRRRPAAVATSTSRTASTYADDIREQAPDIEGVDILLGGQIFADFEPPESEVLGIGFAIVILILAFGSVLAMGLPIGMAARRHRRRRRHHRHRLERHADAGLHRRPWR